MKVLVCLPTKNEKESIQLMIDSIKRLNLDLIICDEQSTDGTIETAYRNSVPVCQRDGKGKGFGVIKALEVASEKGYDFLVLIDCDYSYPPEHIPELLKFLPEHDLVIGTRNMKNIPFSHRLVNILHTSSINLLFGTRLKDINSGLRILKVDRFHGLVDAKNFDIEAQITTRSLKERFKIKEIPIEYRRRKGKSKINALHTFVILNTILKERFIGRK